MKRLLTLVALLITLSVTSQIQVVQFKLIGMPQMGLIG